MERYKYKYRVNSCPADEVIVQNCVKPEILNYLQVNKLGCHSLWVLEIDRKIPELETKEKFISHGNSNRQNISINLTYIPSPEFPQSNKKVDQMFTSTHTQ